jgi:hypothetical protein
MASLGLIFFICRMMELEQDPLPHQHSDSVYYPPKYSNNGNYIYNGNVSYPKMIQ